MRNIAVRIIVRPRGRGAFPAARTTLFPGEPSRAHRTRPSCRPDRVRAVLQPAGHRLRPVRRRRRRGREQAVGRRPLALSHPRGQGPRAAELEKLTLADGDVPGVKTEKAGADDVARTAEVTTDKAACQPIAQAGGLAPVGKAVTTTERIAATVPADEAGLKSMSVTSVQLASYDGKGAEEALASLKAAGEACAGGFVTTVKGEKTRIKRSRRPP